MRLCSARRVSVAGIVVSAFWAHGSPAQPASVSSGEVPGAPDPTTSTPPPEPTGPTAAPPAYPAPPQPPPNYGPWPPPYSSSPPPPVSPPAAEPEPSEWAPSQPGVILSVERAFGVYGSSGGPSTGGWSGSSINFLGGSPTGDFDPFSVPFVALYGVFGRGFTFGGGIGYQGASQKQTGTHNDLSAIVLAPRIGFITSGKTVAIWLRGGLTYSSQRFEYSADCTPGDSTCAAASSKQTFSVIDASFDPMVVFTPIPRVGILVGPAIEIALSGKQSLDIPASAGVVSTTPSTGESDFRLSSFGVAAGLALFL